MRLVARNPMQMLLCSPQAATPLAGKTMMADMLAHMKAEPAKAGFSIALRGDLQCRYLQVHVDVASKLGGISLDRLPLHCLPDGAPCICKLLPSLAITRLAC